MAILGASVWVRNKEHEGSEDGVEGHDLHIPNGQKRDYELSGQSELQQRLPRLRNTRTKGWQEDVVFLPLIQSNTEFA